MSTRASSSATPEQRRVNTVSIGTNALPSASSNSATGVVGSGIGGVGVGVGGVEQGGASTSSQVNGGGVTGVAGGGGGLKNGRTIISGLSQASSKMRKAEALARFHPKMITAQIVALQCFQYLTQSIFIEINYMFMNIPPSVDRIFTDKYIHIWRREGWADCFVILLSALTGAIGLVVIVEKSKKFLDFTFTYFILHLVLSCLFGGVPATFDWWIMHILALIIMVVLGEYLCSLKELELIPLLQVI